MKHPALVHACTIAKMEKEETEVTRVNIHLNRMKSNKQKEVDTVSLSICKIADKVDLLATVISDLVESFFALYTFFSPV